MSRFVRLSKRTAQALLDFYDGVAVTVDVAELRGALKVKVRKSVKLARERKTVKRKTKKEETAEIRNAVFARAFGRCELCFTLPPDDLHHIFGRKEPQSVRNTAAICRPCHRNLTNNLGGAAIWVKAQHAHLVRRGFMAEASRMGAKLEALDLKAQQEFAMAK